MRTKILRGSAAQGRPYRDDRAATVVEMSIVALLVFTFILAVIEFGLLFRDNLTATDAVADASRIGAVIGPDVQFDGSTADYAIVKSIREGMASLSDDTIQYVVVFKASGGDQPADEQVPAACRNGIPINGICNVYRATAAFSAVESGDVAYFTCGGVNTAACSWNPTSRRDGPRSSDVETLGVYVKIELDGYTGLFSESWTITRATVARLEPGVTSP